MITVTYFAITSLSTVGFGDYHPRGDTERIATVLILLFGVAIFSYIMGIFIEILDKISQFNADLDEGDGLAKFFGILQKFNNHSQIDPDIEQRITAFFDYKWQNDRIVAFQEEQDISHYSELPRDVQCSIFVDFLFREFLEHFLVKTFTFKNIFVSNQPAYYSWDDHNYKIFMLEILTHLEPRQELPGTIILNELDEVNDVLFFTTGQCDIGFEINRVQDYVLR